MKSSFGLLVSLAFIFVQCRRESQPEITKNEMLNIVTSLDNQFGVAVYQKDSAALVNIYTDSAQYVQPNRSILVGKTEIGKDWGGFLRMKEHPINIIFNIHDVNGSREIIYETGNGYTLLEDSTKWRFNYVNVWRLKGNGVYKLDIDTYTPLDSKP